MEIIISEQVRNAFPELHLAYLEVEGMSVGVKSQRVSELLREISMELVQSSDIDTLKDRPDFRRYRDFFWKIGVDPTKVRPAAEALVRRIVRGAPLPRINDFVDAYNAASVRSGIPIAAFDSQTLDDEVLLRFSGKGEEFLGIGMEEPKMLDDGQLVISSGEEIIAIYPYRDGDASKITLETKDALLIACGVPGIEDDQVLAAARLARDFVIDICRGRPSKIALV